MLIQNEEINIINRIVGNIHEAHRVYSNLFCDSFSVNSLLCDIITNDEDVEFISRCGCSLFDDANPFGEFYYIKILNRIDLLLTNTYIEKDEIGSRIFEEISQGKNANVRRFFAHLLESALELKGCPTKIFKWQNCPICGNNILSYEERCSSCNTNVDTFDHIEGVLIESKGIIVNQIRIDWPLLSRIANKINFPITKHGSFYSLKVEIENLIEQKEKLWKKEEENLREKEKQEKIQEALRAINELESRINIEAGKQSPNFDIILTELTTNPNICEALRFNDLVLYNRIEQVKQIAQTKKIEIEFYASVARLIKLENTLEREISSTIKHIDEVKKLLGEAEDEFSKVVIGLKKGFQIQSTSDKKEINRYEQQVRPNVIGYINTFESNSLINSQRDQIATAASGLLTIINRCQAKDFRWKELNVRFDQEIEKNAKFSDFRSKCKDEYDIIVKPLREALDRLHRQENKFKETASKKKKKKKLAIILSPIAAVLLTMCLLVCFTVVLPICRMPISVSRVTSKEYTVTGMRGEGREKLDIPEELPKLFFTGGRKIVSISDQAFTNDTVLKTATLPATITNIGQEAFAGCVSLNSVYIRSIDPPKMSTDSFKGTDNLFYVPQSVYENYLDDELWSVLGGRIFPDYGNDDLHGCILFIPGNGESVSAIQSHALNTAFPVLPVPEWPGREFKGWYSLDTNEKIEPHQTIMKSDVKLYAQWDTAQYSISYELNGGIIEGDVTESYTIYSDPIKLPSANKLGCTFGGWYKNSDFSGVRYEEIARGSYGNIIMYAKWIPYKYVFNFETFGGELIASISANYGEKLNAKTPAPPIEGKFSSGYMFAGWSRTYSNGNGVADNLIDIDNIPYLGEQNSTITLYAVWTPTPSEWFKFEKINSTLYVTGLTEEWNNYEGILNKNILFIPDSYGSSYIAGIGANAFAKNISIEEVFIPTTVQQIGENAFAECVNLTTVKFLFDAKLSGGLVIKEKAFYGCAKLRTIDGGENTEEVGPKAFENTYWIQHSLNDHSYFLSLGKVILHYNALGGLDIAANSFPTNATIIGYEAFRDISSDKGGKITIPDTIAMICDMAFANSGFTEVVLPINAKYGDNIFINSRVEILTVRANIINLKSLFGDSPFTLKKLIINSTSTSININGGGIIVETLSASDNKYTSVTLSNFNKITEVNLYNNNISALSINNIPIQTLNLTNNKLTSLSLNNLMANKLMLVGNQLTSI